MTSVDRRSHSHLHPRAGHGPRRAIAVGLLVWLGLMAIAGGASLVSKPGRQRHEVAVEHG
jgi:hypothetical protein